MLEIRCPYCGLRPESEFNCGGPSGIARPGPPPDVTDEQWAEYLFVRDNPRGPLAETWLHAFGCLEWFCALRDTATHEILATWKMGEAAPGVARR